MAMLILYFGISITKSVVPTTAWQRGGIARIVFGLHVGVGIGCCCLDDGFVFGRQCVIEVKVQFNIKGTKWVKEGRENYITNLDAWRMETMKMDQSNNGADSVNYNDMPPATDNVDDLPF